MEIHHGRLDILSKVGIKLTTDEENALNKDYMSETELLLSKLDECQDYQDNKAKSSKQN